VRAIDDGNALQPLTIDHRADNEASEERVCMDNVRSKIDDRLLDASLKTTHRGRISPGPCKADTKISLGDMSELVPGPNHPQIIVAQMGGLIDQDCVKVTGGAANQRFGNVQHSDRRKIAVGRRRIADQIEGVH
jgi:hypothetical protein